MAYPIRTYTLEQYNNRAGLKLSLLEQNVMYYYPNISDIGSVQWSVNLVNVNNPKNILVNITSVLIEPGYRVMWTKQVDDGAEKYRLLYWGFDQNIALDQKYDPGTYGVAGFKILVKRLSGGGGGDPGMGF